MEGKVKRGDLILSGSLEMLILISFKNRKDSIKRHICPAMHMYDKAEVKIMTMKVYSRLQCIFQPQP